MFQNFLFVKTTRLSCKLLGQTLILFRILIIYAIPVELVSFLMMVDMLTALNFWICSFYKFCRLTIMNLFFYFSVQTTWYPAQTILCLLDTSLQCCTFSPPTTASLASKSKLEPFLCSSVGWIWSSIYESK